MDHEGLERIWRLIKTIDKVNEKTTEQKEEELVL